MPCCALAVHQLRYHLVFGAHADVALTRDGHAYLAGLEPFVLLAVAFAVGGFAGRLARAWQVGADSSRTDSLVRVWILCALVLWAIYCGQELLEGVLAGGHPTGVAGIVGHGGWIAAPVAVGLGGALAVALRLADTAIGLTARRSPPRRTATGTASVQPTLSGSARDERDWRLGPYAGAAAGRAPPPAVALG
ncbi:MAG: hypothetical protein ACR2OB_13640 [Solirubrobacteraceae bacterium]